MNAYDRRTDRPGYSMALYAYMCVARVLLSKIMQWAIDGVFQLNYATLQQDAVVQTLKLH